MITILTIVNMFLLLFLILLIIISILIVHILITCFLIKIDARASEVEADYEKAD